MKEENTYKRYNEGDHQYDDFSEAIFEQDTSHKCPTYVHRLHHVRVVALQARI
jgi:hypothetical protein